MVSFGRISAGVCLTFAVAGEAAALEYCVTCEGPPAMYRCVVDGTAEGPGTDSSVSLYCISQMAKRGGHDTCTVSRGAPFPCPGLTAVVEQPKQPTLAAPPPAQEKGAPLPHAHPAETNPPDPAGPVQDKAAMPEAEKPAKVPRTVEELAGQTVKSSKEGLEKAGEAIGGTAKKAGEQIGNAGSAIGNAASKTWTCITSLFSSCGSDEDEHEAPADEPSKN